MTLDQIDRMVRQANPVPDPATLDAPVADHTTRSEAVTFELRPRSNRRLFVALAVAASLVVGILAVVQLADRADHANGPGSFGSDDAVSVAETFMRAWIAGDGIGAAALIADDGDFSAGTVSGSANESFPAVEGVELIPALRDWYGALDASFYDGGCEPTESSPPSASATILFCRYSVETTLTRALRHPPINGAFSIWVDGDGIITAVEDPLMIDVQADVTDVFRTWLIATHPEDLERMYADSGRVSTLTPRLDAASIARWGQYAPEFAGTVGARHEQDRPLTRREFGARARAICGAASIAFQADYVGLEPNSPATNPAVYDALIRRSERALEQLRELPVVDEDRTEVESILIAIENVLEVDRQQAVAAAKEDWALVRTLSSSAAELAREKNELGGIDVFQCPVFSAG